MTAPPNHPKPPTWSAWKAQNGGKGWYWRAPLTIEWALEWFVYCLRSLALFDLLELAGRCTVLVIAILWVLEADDRAKERHYRAWELINSARGSTGDGGRRDALQDLNKDGVSLVAAPLQQAYLRRVDLEGAELGDANLQDADLWGANLRGANLKNANLQDADFGDANLRGADFGYANLQGAVLINANLQDANFGYANLQGAYLRGANLQGAVLRGANLTQGQLDAAYGDDRTVLPDGLTRPAHWSKAEGTEGPPAAQPDDAGRTPAAAVAPGSDK